MSGLASPVLVTGATGFIGARLAERLIEEGERPRLMVRDPAKLRPQLAAQAEIVTADLTDPASLPAALRGAGTVFHCAGNVATWDKWAHYHRANVLGPRALFAAMEQVGLPAGRFVHLSSVDVYGFPQTACAETATATGGAFGYGRSKAQGEAELRAAAARLGLSYVILRPCNVVGPHSQFIGRLGDELRSPLMLKVGHGHADFGFLYVDNLIDCMFWAATAPAAEAGCYNVRDPAAITWSRFLADLGQGVGARALIPDLPFKVADLAARVIEIPWRLLPLPGEPLLHPLLVRIFGRGCGHDITRIGQAGAPLGGIGYDEGMRRSLAWYRETRKV